MSSDLTIQSVDRALEILVYLHHEGKETGVTKIANDLGVYKSTVYRSLATMESRGFVRKNPETDKYWLGQRLFVLGKAVEEHLGLAEIIRPYARKLSQQYQEVVNVSILEENPGDAYRSIIILKESNPGQMLTVSPPVGSSCYCHISSVGKCLLAFGREIDLSVYEQIEMCRLTPNTITNVEKLRVVLEQVRTQGYAIDQEEQEMGLTCIGAPILNRAGYAVAAISMSGPTSRMLSGDVAVRIESLKKIAKEISAHL